MIKYIGQALLMCGAMLLLTLVLYAIGELYGAFAEFGCMAGLLIVAGIIFIVIGKRNESNRT